MDFLKVKPNKKIQNYSFNTNSILGKGTSGTVYIGCHDKTNQPVAIKVIDFHILSNEYA